MPNKILQIVLPWIEKEKEEQNADIEKISELIKILEPSKMKEWFEDIGTSGYLKEKNSMMDSYFIFTELPTTFFYRRKLTEAYLNFNKSFTKLRSFLVSNFFTNISDKDFTQLQPDLKNNNPDLYSKKLTELQTLTSETYKKYTILISIGKEKYIGCMTITICLLLLLLVIVSIWFTS